MKGSIGASMTARRSQSKLFVSWSFQCKCCKEWIKYKWIGINKIPINLKNESRHYCKLDSYLKKEKRAQIAKTSGSCLFAESPVEQTSLLDK